MHNQPETFEKSRNTKKCIAVFSSKLVLCALLCAFFVLCAFFIPRTVTYEYSNATEQKSLETDAASQVSETLRLIREKDGKIGIFKTDGSLIRTVNVSVDSLPDYDKQLLMEGIVAEENEITELVENLTS